MLEFILGVAAVALCAIADQLVLLRGAVEEQAKASASVRQRQELDEEILHSCPNLFYQFKPGLREWFVIHRRNSDHYKTNKRFGDVVSPHSDEESSWFDIYSRLEEKAGNGQKAQLAAIASDADGFLREGSKAALTPTELNFLAFQEWRDLLSEGGTKRFSASCTVIFRSVSNRILKITGDHPGRLANKHLQPSAAGATMSRRG